MQQVFAWTFGDVIDLAVAVVVAAVWLAIAGKQWWRERMCKHNDGVSETMACDAICRQCGKNLGFIGKWREQQRNA